MKYKMYSEILEQPDSIRRTFEMELDNMEEVSHKLAKADKIYLIGCGSSLSSNYSIKNALGMVTDLNIEVFTGYEFFYNKKLDNEKNIATIFTSQSGETADTLAALKRSNELGIKTIAISNEKDSSMIKESNFPIITHCGREESIIGTKTYVTQLFVLYYILFSASDYEKKDDLLKDLISVPGLMEELIENTEEENKKLAYKLKNEDIFYAIGSGPNYGLAYKLAMTMLMEGSLKHSCSLYSGEFRHGLIERAEKDVPIIILDANYPSDKLTQKTIDFCENIGVKTLTFKMQNYTNINNLLSPLILVIPLEWFVFYLAHYNDVDPGSTRHIGKIRYE
jgi:glucosamine--fructose-6-phosphate aminotransferase (isomerizing)